MLQSRRTLVDEVNNEVFYLLDGREVDPELPYCTFCGVRLDEEDYDQIKEMLCPECLQEVEEK